MLDDDEFRPATYDRGKQARAQRLVAQRARFEPSSALLEVETAAVQDLLARHASRSDLLSQMAGLTWSLGVVDLRSLIAFQRRIVSTLRSLLYVHPRLMIGRPSPPFLAASNRQNTRLFGSPTRILSFSDPAIPT